MGRPHRKQLSLRPMLCWSISFRGLARSWKEGQQPPFPMLTQQRWSGSRMMVVHWSDVEESELRALVMLWVLWWLCSSCSSSKRTPMHKWWLLFARLRRCNKRLKSGLASFASKLDSWSRSKRTAMTGRTLRSIVGSSGWRPLERDHKQVQMSQLAREKETVQDRLVQITRERDTALRVSENRRRAWEMHRIYVGYS